MLTKAAFILYSKNSNIAAYCYFITILPFLQYFKSNKFSIGKHKGTPSKT